MDECTLFEAFLTLDSADEDALQGRRLSDVKVSWLELKLHNRQVLFNFDFFVVDVGNQVPGLRHFPHLFHLRQNNVRRRVVEDVLQLIEPVLSIVLKAPVVELDLEPVFQKFVLNVWDFAAIPQVGDNYLKDVRVSVDKYGPVVRHLQSVSA